MPVVLRSVFAAFQNPTLPHHGRKRAVFALASLVFLSSGNARAQVPVEVDAVSRIFTTLPVVPVPERMSQE